MVLLVILTSLFREIKIYTFQTIFYPKVPATIPADKLKAEMSKGQRAVIGYLLSGLLRLTYDFGSRMSVICLMPRRGGPFAFVGRRACAA